MAFNFKAVKQRLTGRKNTVEDSWSSTKVLDADGKEIPNCFIAGDKELLDKTLEIEKKYTGHPYSIDPSVNAEPDMLSEYIALEKRQARRTAVHLLGEGVIPESAAATVPVVFGPDSGLHTAEGVMDGLWCASSLDAKLIASYQNVLPPEAIDLAAKSGVLIYCDSVSCGGGSASNTLAQLPKDLTGPDGKPIKVITYFNYAYNIDRSNTSPGFNKLSQPSRLIKSAAPHEVYFIANAVGGGDNDLFDRADAIAKIAATNEKLRPYTDKFLKPDQHHVGKHTR